MRDRGLVLGASRRPPQKATSARFDLVIYVNPLISHPFLATVAFLPRCLLQYDKQTTSGTALAKTRLQSSHDLHAYPTELLMLSRKPNA
jgi:hypothetical protein